MAVAAGKHPSEPTPGHRFDDHTDPAAASLRTGSDVARRPKE